MDDKLAELLAAWRADDRMITREEFSAIARLAEQEIERLKEECDGWQKLVNDSERAIGMGSVATCPEARSLVEWCDERRQEIERLKELEQHGTAVFKAAAELGHSVYSSQSPVSFLLAEIERLTSWNDDLRAQTQAAIELAERMKGEIELLRGNKEGGD